MSSVNLEKVIEGVKALAPDEQRQVRQLIDSLLLILIDLLLTTSDAAPEVSPEDRLDQLLLEAGVISEIPPPITDFTPYQNRKPIEVRGKPVSETIIEERR